MFGKRTRVVGITVVSLFALYVLAGFFAVPPLVKRILVQHVEEKLKHKLALGEIKFNPLALTVEMTDFDLRESGGGALIAFKRLFVNFQASSLFRRAWTFAEVSVDGCALNGELRADGTHNFSALLAALRDPEPKPDAPPPRLVVDKIAITDGRVDLADRQGGDTARLRLAPLAFELTHLSTLPAEKSPYKLTARTADGEQLQWGGEVTLNPVASWGTLALSKWRVSTLARLLGNRIDIETPAGELDARLTYNVNYANGKVELAIADTSFKLAGVKITPKGAAEPLAAVEAFEAGGIKLELGTRNATVERVALAKGAIALAVEPDGRGNWIALLPSAKHAPPTAQPPSDPPQTTAPAPTASAPGWRISIPDIAITDLGLKFADKRPSSRLEATLDGIGLNLAARLEPEGETATFSLDAPKLKVAQASLTRSTQSLTTTEIAIQSGVLKTQQASTGTALTVTDAKIAAANLAMRQARDEMRVQTLALSTPSLQAKLPADASAAIEAVMADFALEITGVAAKLAAAKADSLELRSVSAGAGSTSIVLAGDVPDLKANGLRATVSGLSVREPPGTTELARLGRLEADGGALDLRQRLATVERINAVDGHAAAAIRSDGKLNWDALLSAVMPADAKPAAPPAKTAGAAPWKAAVKTIALKNFGAQYADERQKPALSLAVQDLNAQIRNASTEPKSVAQVDLTGRVKDGGQFSAAGRVNAHTPSADLKVKIADLSLVPVQPLIAPHVRLELLSALAALDGRVRYNRDRSAGANVLFEGEFALSKVALDEVEPKQPFLSLDLARASEIRLALEPNRLEIPELRVSGLATKLLIAEDQSVNVAKLKRQPTQATATPAPAPSPPASATTAAPATAQADFPISISRIRIDNTRLEFADLSLRPQFATRMHDLQGVITGVSTSRDSRAQLELEARIDEFGSARIRGGINPFQPRVYTDIDMVFRNLAMTSLTPYSAKFAGYRIASGQLSMDLQYKIKNGALLGENKLVLDKLELGERVESPSAFNLPLELAIAILKDSDGRIDIGLPVSGSLDDPQFSYGALVWKAIGNLLTRIVTAPFRALANLFGGSSEKLGSIEFDAGADRLQPPERQKLRTVAEALQKRPQLKLTVKPAYSASADRPALQSLAARRAISERAGIKLQPGESPGPLDYGNTRMQQAIQAVFDEKFGAPASRDLRAALDKAAKSAADPGKPPAKPQPVSPDMVARSMVERLVGSYTVDDTALADLAKRRATAIEQELREAGKVDPARLASASPQAADGGSDKIVVIELDLGVAK